MTSGRRYEDWAVRIIKRLKQIKEIRMKAIRSILGQVIILTLGNSVALWALTDFGTGVKAGAAAVLSVLYIILLINAGGKRDSDKKLARIAKGAYLIDSAVCALVLETAVIIVFIIIGGMSVWRHIGSGLLAFGLITITAIAGLVRLAGSARQIKLALYAALIFCWYIPVVNIIILKKISRSARKEFRFEQAKHELDDLRKENEVCKTRYPILMVHGIFFRDWQKFNYWGRIPKELIRNGAEVYYGGQQSADPIPVSAAELRDRILEVIGQSGAEKVNIIAHSKGGLDSRYAISKLGMDEYVASLTTINTPHYGCKFVDNILSKVSDGLLKFVARRYDRLFTVLGDTEPSFEKGLRELTFENCSKLDDELPDSPKVRYKSVMSKMNGLFSAGFPLNLGYLLNKPYGSGNDGLVTVESALRGENTLMIEHKGKRGLSHGDLIDLFRENIDGFDVREFYVELVKELKDSGF